MRRTKLAGRHPIRGDVATVSLHGRLLKPPSSILDETNSAGDSTVFSGCSSGPIATHLFPSHPSRIIGPSMPSFPDTAVLVLLALLLFGPKKLPVLARQLGKLMADFRRASNEFRTQMEEELRISEQAERQKQVAAIEASAPSTVAETIPEPEHPHLDTVSTDDSESISAYERESLADLTSESAAFTEPAATPLPIAISGELS